MPPFSCTRRRLLRLTAFAGAAALVPVRFHAQSAPSADAVRRITRYLETLARPAGGYAWGDQERSHLTPTFGVIGAYRALGVMPPRPEALADYVRRNHPRELKKLEQERRIFEFQQVQALAWLGADLAEFRPRIAALTQPLGYLKQYERNGYPVLQSELGAVLSHALLGLPTAGIADAFGRYIGERRRANGSYNNTPAADGGDGHVMNTLWALQARRVLGAASGEDAVAVAWLRACQRPGGGFTWQPDPEFAGVDDVAYTRAAVKALQLLGAEPADRPACLEQILSLANDDGGFGDRPGWASNATATYYALDALATLGALGALDRLKPRPRPARSTLPAGLQVFSLQLQSHGQGSPAEAVDLARSLRIHLWGAKNAKPEWMARVRALAAQDPVPVMFFPANEEYGTWVDVPGLGTYSHTSDLFAPGDTDIGPSLAGPRAVSWPDFRARRLAPLERGRGRLFWQFGENEELVRLFLDDSVERGGYAAISTFHFGNPDFMNSEPFLNRWRGRIPFVSIQDAHGPEPWWFADQTTGYRTLFLAREPTWDGWLEALRRNWVAAVRHDGWTSGATWLHAGSDKVSEFVRSRESEWRWWDSAASARPMVSLVVVHAHDLLEPARPETGAMLRVRCAWENTPQGLLRTPLAELVRLEVDGRDVQPTLVSPVRPNGLRTDHHHRWPLQDLAPGRHLASAVVRVRATNAEVRRNLEFSL
ncbi:MAG: hypothetical protein JNL92_10535 [Opitutaceae bacterium]|nr:hypothetical protein [Opitutaceae bacterium]